MAETAPDADLDLGIVEPHDLLVLGARESRAFVEALLDPPPIIDRLRDSVRRYRAAMVVTSD